MSVDNSNVVRITDRINESLFIGLYLGYLAVYELIDGTLSLKSTSEYSALYLNGCYPIYLGNNKVSACSQADGQYEWFVSIYDVNTTTGVITLLGKISVGTASSAYSAYHKYLGIFDDNQVVYCFYRYLRSSGTSEYNLGIIDYSDPTNVHKIGSISLVSGLTYSSSVGFIGSGNGKVAYGKTGKPSSSSSSTSYYKCIAQISEGSLTETSESISSSQFNALFLITQSTISDIKEYPDTSKRFFFNGVGLFDSTEDAFYITSTTSMGLPSYIQAIENIGNNKMIVFCDGKFYLLSFNSESKQFIVLSTVPYTLVITGTITTYDILGMNNNALIFFREYKTNPATYTQRYGILNIDNNNVVMGTPTDKVKEWAGSGNPIGVAKQNGNAGDIIEVYVPTANT